MGYGLHLGVCSCRIVTVQQSQCSIVANGMPMVHSCTQLQITNGLLALPYCALLQAVRDSEWEGREVARTRNNQEQAISLETPYYDICRIQVRAAAGARALIACQHWIWFSLCYIPSSQPPPPPPPHGAP